MIDTGTYLPLRLFYGPSSDLSELTFNRKECEGISHVEFFHYPLGYLPYLQYMSAPTSPQEYEQGNILFYFSLVDACTHETVATNVTMQGWRTGFIVEGGPTHGITFHTYHNRMVDFGPNPMPSPGLYYLVEHNIGAEGYYSDPFFWGDTSDMIHLKWWGRPGKIIGDFYWRDGMFAECYINDVIQRPTYPILEEVREDQELDTHKVFQKWDKRHAIRFRGVESMCDAMSVLPTMEYVYIGGVRVYDVLVNIAWEEDEPCIGIIELTFSHKKFVKTF
jgi:hypothetical protein